MAVLTTTEAIACRFSPYIAELHEVFEQHHMSFGAPEDVGPLADRLAAPGLLPDDVASLLRSIVLREGGSVPQTELLEILAVAVGGAEVEATTPEARGAFRQLLSFVGSVARRPWNVPPGDLPEADEPADQARGAVNAAQGHDAAADVREAGLTEVTQEPRRVLESSGGTTVQEIAQGEEPTEEQPRELHQIGLASSAAVARAAEMAGAPGRNGATDAAATRPFEGGARRVVQAIAVGRPSSPDEARVEAERVALPKAAGAGTMYMGASAPVLAGAGVSAGGMGSARAVPKPRPEPRARPEFRPRVEPRIARPVQPLVNEREWPTEQTEESQAAEQDSAAVPPLPPAASRLASSSLPLWLGAMGAVGLVLVLAMWTRWLYTPAQAAATANVAPGRTGSAAMPGSAHPAGAGAVAAIGVAGLSQTAVSTARQRSAGGDEQDAARRPRRTEIARTDASPSLERAVRRTPAPSTGLTGTTDSYGTATASSAGYGTGSASPQTGAGVAGAPVVAQTAPAREGSIEWSSLPQPVRGKIPYLPVSAAAMASHLLLSTEPEYPMVAKLTHIHGDVTVQAVISTTGQVVAAHGVGGHRLLRGAAAAAVKRWRYRPYMLDGRPVAVSTLVTVKFEAQ